MGEHAGGVVLGLDTDVGSEAEPALDVRAALAAHRVDVADLNLVSAIAELGESRRKVLVQWQLVIELVAGGIGDGQVDDPAMAAPDRLRMCLADTREAAREV